MLVSPARVPAVGARRLSAALHGYAFLNDFILLYPLYALFFTDAGLTVAEVSSLFVIWSVAGMLLEVPSGVWADVASRRLLLTVAPLFAGAGFALWTVVPSYWAFALGFVLWGLAGALQSGALEALVWAELDRLGAADRYARLMGRARAAGTVAVVAATAGAGPVLALGGPAAVGWASVAACLLAAAAGAALPEHRTAGPGPDEPEPGYLGTFRAGLAVARRDRRVRSALLTLAVVVAVWGALEEYVALLALDTGVGEAAVPLLMLLVWAGVTAGGLLGGVGRRMSPRAFGVTTALAALALAAGSLAGRPAGIVLVAVAFGVFQLASVLADARLQERITGPHRATVTSLAGLGTELVTVAVYAAYGGGSALLPNGVLFALCAVPYLLVALAFAGRSGGAAQGSNL